MPRAAGNSSYIVFHFSIEISLNIFYPAVYFTKLLTGKSRSEAKSLMRDHS